MNSPKRLAIVAHDVSPLQGSEAGNAWRLLVELERQGVSVEVIVAETNQLGTSNYRSQLLVACRDFRHVSFRYVPHPKCVPAIARLAEALIGFGSPTGNPVLYSFLYRLWLKKVERVLIQQRYDIVHLLNHISIRWPFSRHFLIDTQAKLVWGPTSGAVLIPPRYFERLSLSKAVQVVTRNLLVKVLMRSRHVLLMIQRCSKVFVVAEEDRAFVASRGGRAELQLDAFARRRDIKVRTRKAGEVLRVLFVGRMHWLKCPQVAVRAVEGLDGVHLTIAGDGPELEALRNYCRNKSISNVAFLGALPKDRIEALYYESHVLLHPSIREAGGSVVIEAIETGMPIIAHDAFGMGPLMRRYGCGIGVPLRNEVASRRDFRDALLLLVTDNSRLEALSRNAVIARDGILVESFVAALRAEYR